MGHGSSRAARAGRPTTGVVSDSKRIQSVGPKKKSSINSSMESGFSGSDPQTCDDDCVYCQRTCSCYSDLQGEKHAKCVDSDQSDTEEEDEDEDDEEDSDSEVEAEAPVYSVCKPTSDNSTTSELKTSAADPNKRNSLVHNQQVPKTVEKNGTFQNGHASIRTVGASRVGTLIPENRGLRSETATHRGFANQESLAPSVLAFDDILSGAFAAFQQASKTIGGDVAKHADLVNQGFTAQRKFLVVASRSKKPADADLMKLLTPTSEIIQSIQRFREQNRTSQLFNHLSAISESIPALGWVTVAPAPSPYVKEMNDAGQFYTNRVLKDWKEKDKNHVDWVRSWVQVLTELQAFVKQHHTTGLVWNNNGGDAMQNAAKAGSAPAARGGAGAPPPPGPPPPPMPNRDLFAEESGPDASRAQLFASLNKGEDVTKGLKKVTSDMQTHKNPTLRAANTVPAVEKPSVGPKPGASPAVAPARPPRMELDGKKWVVEYQKNQSGLVISQTGMNQTVYIFKCEGTTVQVKGKVNSIVLDSCKKTSIVLDSVVSSVEFINCQSVQMQVLVKVPTVSIDKTDGCQIYLNDGSLDVSIVSAKSSEMNVLVPKGDGDYTEYPIPEQYKTTYNGKGLTTVISEST